MSLIDVLRASASSDWPAGGSASALREIPGGAAGLRGKARKRALRAGSLRYSSSPFPEPSGGSSGSPCVRVGLLNHGPVVGEVQRHRLGKPVEEFLTSEVPPPPSPWLTYCRILCQLQGTFVVIRGGDGRAGKWTSSPPLVTKDGSAGLL